MSFSSNEIIFEAQRGRQWSPLLTQQLRLRHINQIWCLNLNSEIVKAGSFYFTLHLTSMSAPFFTSERIHGPHPKWQDLILNKFPSASAFVLRIWCRHGDNPDTDTILVTWGLHLSGLVYFSNRAIDMQPTLFLQNSIIFSMVGGFFVAANSIRADVTLPSSAALVVTKRVTTTCARGDLKRSYCVDKLRKLHYLEVMIKNKTLDVQRMSDSIAQLDVMTQGGCNEAHELPAKMPSQLLTMNCLNRMLQEKPTREQKQEIFKLRKKIELSTFRYKLLRQERDGKLGILKQLRKTVSSLSESNSERECSLTEQYHTLNRDKEKLREFHKVVMQHRELMIHSNSQLQHRKRQLLQQLLWIYPINQTVDNKYTIKGMCLPNADVLSDANDDGIAVALGYVTHILTMCSNFLQVPLRYPMTHYGSRSTVEDPVVANLPEREFPLFTKGKDRMQFTYGVYLLNKNIAQLRWLYFMHTPDLKLTLPNLLSFLQGYKEFKQERFLLLRPFSEQHAVNESHTTHHASKPALTLDSFESYRQRSDPILDCLRRDKPPVDPSGSKQCKTTTEHGRVDNGNAVHHCPGLSEILAIPEAYLNRQIGGISFRNYLSSCKTENNTGIGKSDSSVDLENGRKSSKDAENAQVSCDIHLSTNDRINKEYMLQHSESVEEGTDLLNPKSTVIDLVVGDDCKEDDQIKLIATNKNQLSYSNSQKVMTENLNQNSTDVLDSKNLMSRDHEEFMQNWLRTGPALVCTDKNLYPEEFLGTQSSVQNADSPLTARTDALLTTKSFNLVKPRHS
ncbi:hypothetical protein WA026_016315 [Henosepilachna vigintioctopunctata]|uniref:UV radiation resistance-associated gene protein n=1 Tax=Henosepilachna vigintioctopunctata TaxID=420089 RepID=A0AAW1UPN5_9CUCU